MTHFFHRKVNFLFTVEMADKMTCQRSDHVRTTSTAGYIASVVSEETGCGTGQTPWIIEEQEGQRINITLIDFNVYENGKVSLTPRRITNVKGKFCPIHKELLRAKFSNQNSSFHSHLVRILEHKILSVL